MTDESSTPPGWYPDPSGDAQWRAWNGRAWTDMVRPFHGGRGPVAYLTVERTHRNLLRVGVPMHVVGLTMTSQSLHLLAQLPLQSSLTSARSSVLSSLVLLGVVLIALGNGVALRAVSSFGVTPRLWERLPLVGILVWVRHASLYAGRRSAGLTPSVLVAIIEGGLLFQNSHGHAVSVGEILFSFLLASFLASLIHRVREVAEVRETSHSAA